MKFLMTSMLLMASPAYAAFFSCTKQDRPCNEQGHMYECYCYGWCTPDPFCSEMDRTRKPIKLNAMLRQFTMCGEMNPWNGSPEDATRIMGEKAAAKCEPFAARQISPTRENFHGSFRSCAEFVCDTSVDHL